MKYPIFHSFHLILTMSNLGPIALNINQLKFFLRQANSKLKYQKVHKHLPNISLSL